MRNLYTFSACKAGEHSREKQISFSHLSKCGEAKYTQEEHVYFRPQKTQHIIHIVRKKQDNYQNV